MSYEFEWDDAKARANLKKHGVPFVEALTVFVDPLARIFDDPDHSETEVREIIVGYSTKPRLLVVGFTERSGRVRLIHARPATKAEQKRHEENAKPK
ncbi:MAG: BrnT family toxin [Acidobacteriota bacterium]|nr:BrnT family toxin [Acidobacteriota bacterium]